MKTCDLVERYVVDRPDLSESSVEAVRYAGRLFGGFHRDCAELVTKAIVRKFRAELSRGELAEGTANKHVRWLKSVWRYGREVELLESDPWSCVSSSKRSKPREFRMLSDEEFGRILEACVTPEWRRLFALCRWAGLRRGEALGMRWEDVDVEGRWLTVRGGKTGGREVPMSPRLVPLLSRLATGDSLCPGDNGSLNRVALGIVKLAGVEWYGTVFHALRKMCASSWLGAGIPLADVSKYLGHGEAVLYTYYHRPLSAGMITEAT